MKKNVMLQLRIELKCYDSVLEAHHAVVSHVVDVPEELLEALRVLRKASNKPEKYVISIRLEGGAEVKSYADLD